MVVWRHEGGGWHAGVEVKPPWPRDRSLSPRRARERGRGDRGGRGEDCGRELRSEHLRREGKAVRACSMKSLRQGQHLELRFGKAW